MRFSFRVIVSLISGVSAFFASYYLFAFLVDGVVEHFVHVVHGLDWMEYLAVTGFSAVVTPIVVYYALKRRDAKGIRMPSFVFLSIVLFASFLSIEVFAWFLPVHALQWTASNVFMCLNFFYSSVIVQASLYYLLRSRATLC